MFSKTNGLSLFFACFNIASFLVLTVLKEIFHFNYQSCILIFIFLTAGEGAVKFPATDAYSEFLN
jgi:hypothetical protein